MKLIRGLHNVNPAWFANGCVLTLGNFDGVHRGHQMMLQQLRDAGRVQALPTVVLTFEPMPREYFSPNTAPARLNGLRDKLANLAEYGIDYVLIVRFDADFAALSAAHFINTIVCKQLNAKHIIIGDDYRFGAQRKGDVQLLQALGQRYQFSVVQAHTFSVADARVSSTRIRHALGAAQFDLAAQLLGRAFAITGRVAHGAKRGRQLGFPTANIICPPAWRQRHAPLCGVFAVRVQGMAQYSANDSVFGCANLGLRPTVDGKRTSLEVHLLDFAGDLYGQHLRVSFLHKVRDEQAFASLDELRQHIAQDITRTQQFLTMTETVLQ